MLITPGSGDKYETNVITAAGYRMSIVTTPHGYYKIKAEGKGHPPKICDALFTGLKQAQKALTAWAKDNEIEIAKKERLREIAKRGKSDSE
jgi:hypothetical protein